MTTATVFSNVPYNQNAAGPAVPANTVVNAGSPVTRINATLTVTPTTGWAKASISMGLDGVNFPRGGEVFAAPGSGGVFASSSFHSGSSEIGGWQYFTGEVLECSPGAACTLTVTY